MRSEHEVICRKMPFTGLEHNVSQRAAWPEKEDEASRGRSGL